MRAFQNIKTGNKVLFNDGVNSVYGRIEKVVQYPRGDKELNLIEITVRAIETRLIYTVTPNEVVFI